MIKLDLRYNQLNPEFSQLFNEIAINSRGKFTRLVDNMSKEYSSNLDWWVEGPASRNSFASPLFYQFCSLHLIIELMQSGIRIECVITDSVSLKHVLGILKTKQGFEFKIEGPEDELPQFYYYLWKSAKDILSLWKQKKSQFRYAKKTKHFSHVQDKRNLILIDVFVFPGFVTKDRYYNGLWDELTSEQKKKTFFVPTLVMMREDQFESVYRELRTADRNFLIREDYLNFFDLIFGFLHLIRVWFIKPSPQAVLGIDFSPLVREELLSRREFDSALEGLLNYRFAKGLKKKSIKLSLVINWFENQVIDKGWNAGFNKFYPNVISKGYRGSAPPLLYICSSSPSEVELSSGVLPSIISVIGNGYIELTKEFSDNLIVEKAPAFRFNHLWENNKNVQAKDKYNILVALSIFIEESINILKLVSAISEFNQPREYCFCVSPHPTMSKKTLQKRFGADWPKSFDYVKGTNELLRTSNILISGGLSSICLEAIAQGIPVIVVENPFGFSCNSIPINVPKHLWQSCRTSSDISDTIKYYKKITGEQIIKNKSLSQKIKKDYFEPVTSEGVNKFLEL